MKSRVSNPNSVRAATGTDCSREASLDSQQLILAGRSELPSSDLAQRVGEAIRYRRVLAEARPAWLSSTRRAPKLGVPMTAGAVALAAGALLWWHAGTRQRSLSISAETVAAADHDRNSSTESSGGHRHAPAATQSGDRGRGSAAGISTSASAAVAVSDPCRLRATAIGEQPMIDDFEDGDDEVLALEHRSGLWRWARDTDAPGSAPALLPIPRVTPSGSNRMALHVKGGRLLDWGAIVEFNFKPGCYDASAYRGLKFQAKGPGRVFVAPRETNTIPIAEGGTCTSDCYNPHVKKIELERQWKTYRIEWSEFEQRGYGRPGFDPRRLHSLAFLFRPEDTPYDAWFDDVSFVSR